MLLHGLVIIRLVRRHLVWINVTANPAAEWIARQITEDASYGYVVTRRRAVMGIRDRPTAPRSPWQTDVIDKRFLVELLPDDRKIEWAGSLGEAEAMLVGILAKPPAGPSVDATDFDRLARARAVFREMQQEYAAGHFVRYGELMQQLEKMLLPP